ncbi:MAG TPA: TIGR02391 family protein [Bacteroidales bacterium]|nr:TIGR02391 family protein [Bacteroidales bacterium]HRU33575.1 TIGR02391 family protein [Candidatus Paceibacterota bacterium]
MATLKTNEKQILEKILQMNGGGVLNFTHRTMAEFFRDDVGIDISEEKYNYSSGSKANLMRGFWMASDDALVAKSIRLLISYIETQIVLGNLKREDFPTELVNAGNTIYSRLSGKKIEETESKSLASFKDGNINIILQKDIFDHVQKLLNDGHYFNAVEEAYKVVRKKLKDVSGKEKATEAFCNTNFEKIFGHQPVDDVEKDFFKGVEFLHMAIQFLRNEKAHTPAGDLDKNLAIHYIALASLAYDLISRK